MEDASFQKRGIDEIYNIKEQKQAKIEVGPTLSLPCHTSPSIIPPFESNPWLAGSAGGHRQR